ncbi:MAG: CRISPR-associated endonuclease Cas1 [Syntrophorhabdaceae bacterium]|nr:CRISPR-associated endonuclease Cas1 [Syntrophorhabdaceae bacterium]MDD5242905.1 CRISPR-associated endonuclease Cas1 [Syntrophorhabdaceae bacterium]
MGTVYIDRKGIHIKLDGSALAFYANGEREGMVPLNPLKRIVIIGNSVIESSVFRKLSDDGISLLFLSGRMMRFCGMFHGRLHNNGLLRVKQYEKSLGLFVIEFSREIVRRKVQAQSGLLHDALDRRPDLRFPLTTGLGTIEKIERSLNNVVVNSELCEGVLGILRGLEGSAASAYFSAYTALFPESLGFTKRTRRPPEDPVNALLSLCYTLIHYEMVREIEVIGLDPTIGFYHQFEYGRESLACDLVEIYRPEVDRFVWALCRDRDFTDRDFSYDSERPGCYLKKGARARFYPFYEEWAKTMRPVFVEEVRVLARRVTDGQNALFE